MKMRPLIWTIVATCLSVALTGCGSSGGGGLIPSPGGSGGSGGTGGSGGSGGAKSNDCGSAEPGLCTTIDITGAVTLHGTFHAGLGGGDHLVDTCADYVKGDTEKARLALPIALGEMVDGHNIGIANLIYRHYQGPRTYQRADLGAVDGGLHVDIDHNSYQTNDATTAEASVAADGSGKLTFTNLREATNSSDSSPKGVINGSYSWTCHG